MSIIVISNLHEGLLSHQEKSYSTLRLEPIFAPKIGRIALRSAVDDAIAKLLSAVSTA